MRHGKKINHLGRKSAHRKAMLANMAISLIEHKRIKTTLAKAKALRVYVEPLITKSKNDTTHARRTVFSYLQNKFAIQELFGIISPKIMERPGGYTRILKIGNRLGDNAEMAIIELVDFNEYAPGKLGTGKDKKKRRRKSGGKKGATETVAAPLVEEAEAVEVVDEVVEAPEEENVVENVAETLDEAVEETEEEVTEVMDAEAAEDAVEGDTDEEPKA